MIFPNSVAAASAPYAPDDLSATAISSSEIELEWDYASNATSYYVYRATSSSGTYTLVATVDYEYYTDTGLRSDTTYYYKVKARNSSGTSDYSSRVYATTGDYDSDYDTSVTSNRLAGQERYETSAKIAKAGWDSSYYAVIASGDDFPDALCGAPLAGKYDAPILLTSKYQLESQTKKELTRLDVQSVFIIGGTGVISAGVEQEIKNMGIRVTRIAGQDRYETSVKVAEKMDYVDKAIIATGDNFPDALSIAPIAAMKEIPILLTEKNQLSSQLKKYLKDNIDSTVVVGGTGVVSNTVYNQLPSPKRLSGNNRYETNLNIVKAYLDDLDFETCYLATGENFPDALAGSALAALKKSPIILVNDAVSISTTTLVKGQDVENVVAFGGTGVVSDTVLLSFGSVTSDSSRVPSVPTDLDATEVSSDEIYLDWDAASRATSYYIYRATSANGTYSKIDTVTSTYYYDDGLSEDRTYYYKIQAHNSYGTSSYSSRVSATTDEDDAVTLSVPEDLKAAVQNYNTIYLTWDSVDYATSYYVYRATSSNGTYSKIATVATESYTDAGLPTNKTYYYRIQAHNSSNTSGYSAKVSATTTVIPALNAPVNLQAITNSPTQISLTWDAVPGAASYNIYRTTTENGTYALLTTVTTNYFVNTGLIPGMNCYYKIRAYNGSLSPESAAAFSATPSPNLAEGFVPENFNTHKSTDYVGINVGWNIGPNTDLQNITAMKVELLDINNIVIATNTGVMEQLRTIPGKQFSTPFIIFEGTYTKANDPYWSFGPWTPNVYNPPVKAKITLTDIYGKVYTVENANLTFEVGKAWTDLLNLNISI
jgi:putative cell wall-binding protein